MWTTFGHDSATASLSQAIKAQRASHANLITGPRSTGKFTLALDFACALNCVDTDLAQRPCNECRSCNRTRSRLLADLIVVGEHNEEPAESSTGRIPISAIKEACQRVQVTPIEARRSVVVIPDAHLMTPEASNALLKTLEEPPAAATFILTASDPGALLPTILSRCNHIQLRNVPTPAIAAYLQSHLSVPTDLAETAAASANGCPGTAISIATDPDLAEQAYAEVHRVSVTCSQPLHLRFEYAEEIEKRFRANRQDAYDVLDIWASWWRDVLLASHNVDHLATNRAHITEIRRIAAALQPHQATDYLVRILDTKLMLTRNVSPRLCLDNLMLALPQDY